jgi:hypothetical protein
MSKKSADKTAKLQTAMKRYLDAYPGDLMCALQVWYEGLEGCGVPNPAEMDEMNAFLGGLSGWKAVGNVRYEKFGSQYSFERVK